MHTHIYISLCSGVLDYGDLDAWILQNPGRILDDESTPVHARCMFYRLLLVAGRGLDDGDLDAWILRIRTMRQGVAHVLAPVVGGPDDGDLDTWILQNLDDEAARKARVDALVALARPFSYARTEVLAALGDMYAHNVA